VTELGPEDPRGLLNECVATIVKHDALTPGDRNLLECLVHPFPNGLDPAALAEEMKRRPDWNKVEHSDIRTAVGRVRGHLDDFYNYNPSGKREKMRLRVPLRTPYRIEIDENRQELDPVERFWDPHFSQSAGNLIIFTEPLFYWDQKRRCYVRFLDINYDGSSPIDIMKFRSRVPADYRAHDLQPCFHYQSSGEAQAQQILWKWFERQHSKAEVKVEVSRECVDRNVWENNLIVLGNSRANRFLRELQQGQPIFLSEDGITVRKKSENSKTEYADEPAVSQGSNGGYLHAVVTRLPSKNSQRCATLIAANNGRSLERLATYLTLPDTLKRLYDKLELQPATPLPTSFQLLFRFQTLGHELIAGEPELIDSVWEDPSD
jgi:hypothetical protein